MNNYYLFNYSQTIKDTIQNNNVVSIVCPPGSGASLVIPYSIIDMDRIVVVVDSDESIISLFTYFQQHYPDINVGYHLSTDEAINDDNQIVFYHTKPMTDIFIKSNQNGQCSDISNFNVIIFADIQNFNIEKYIIFNIWNMCQDKKLLPKLVLTGDYIPLGLIKESAILNYPGNLKSIIYNWLDDYIYYENQTFIKEIVNVAVEYFNKIQQNGNFLILIPSGDKTIELKQQLMSKNLTWNIISINDGEIPVETEIAGTVRQVYICDWSNRHIINGKTLILVIDSCISNMSNIFMSNYKLLNYEQLNNHSKIIGIENPGIVHYMLTKRRYLEQTGPSSKISFQKDPSLGRWILKLEENGINPATIFYDNDSHPLVGPVDTFNEYHNIINYKLIDPHRKKLTTVGKFLINLPLTIENGYILYNLLKHKFSFIISIVVVSFLETGFRFGFPKRTDDMTDGQYRQNLFNYQNRYFASLRQKSNIGTAVAIWDKMNRDIRNKNISSIYKWSKQNGIQSNDIIKFYQMMETLKEILTIKIKHSKMDVELSQNIDDFFKRFETFIPTLLPYNIMEYIPEKGQYYNYVNKKLFIQSYYSVNQLTNRNPPYIVALSTIKVGNIDLIDFSYPLDTLVQIPKELVGYFNISPEIIKTIDERSQVIINPDPRVNQALNILSSSEHEEEYNEYRRDMPLEIRKKMLIASRILSTVSEDEPIAENVVEKDTREHQKLLNILQSR